MPNPIHDTKYKIFRQMLIEARQHKGLLQSEVAEKLGKPQSFISKYERGERRIDFPEFLEIAQALEIDVVAFIGAFRDAIRG